MPKRSGVPRDLDMRLTRYLRYEMSELGFEERYEGFRLVDVARKLKVTEDAVVLAVNTMSHRRKGMRYWMGSDEDGTWVGANFWPGDSWRSDLGASETSVWEPWGGQYFWCPSHWARKEGEELVEYIQKWFVCVALPYRRIVVSFT